MSKKTTKNITLAPGRKIGKYSLKRPLGKGGYCEVWRALDNVEGIDVALKIPLAAADGTRKGDDLLKEIRLVAQLRHPHILPMKNADIIDDHVVMATEISKRTLDDCTRPMGAVKLFRIVHQVLEALAYAHQHRVVHCDVNPANIFLLSDGRAVLGDFGIGMKLKGRQVTVDEFGTPGYVAPEQAYGRPTYQSDCFSVAIVLYEFLTGVIPRFPFKWPCKKADRLKAKTSGKFVDFIRKSLQIDPAHRYANGRTMLRAFVEAMPVRIRSQVISYQTTVKSGNWKDLRRETFTKRYSKILGPLKRCDHCREPIIESMHFCPWCRENRNSYEYDSSYDLICPDCQRGILPEWHFCPWCYGPGFEKPASKRTLGVRYHDHCEHCDEPLMNFMSYCPWCHRKVDPPWQLREFPHSCPRCQWSVDADYWSYCPWCGTTI